MAHAETLELTSEIKELERELYRKRCQLQVLGQYGGKKPIVSRTPAEWVEWADELAAKIGAESSGGDAAEEIRYQRSRV